jgi:hypothetical protein
VSFRQVDSSAFREFISYLSLIAKNAMPSSRSAKAWIMQGYRIHKAIVKQELRDSLYKIHLVFDLWTSGNLLSLNGVVAHFLTKNFKPKSILLAIPEQTESHAGIDIAKGVEAVIDDFEISDNLGYFILDNASNNNTAIETLGKKYGFKPI